MSGWGHHNCDTARMAEIIEAEYSNVDGSSKPWTTCKWQNKPKKTKNGGISDQGNEDFSASSGGEGELSSDTENDSDVMEITNKEEFRALLHFYFKIYCDWLDFICSWPTLCLQKLSHLSAASPRQKQRASGHKPSVYDLQFKLMAPTMRPLFHKELLHDKQPKKNLKIRLFFHCSMYLSFSRLESIATLYHFLEENALMQMERWVEWETNITVVTTDIRRYSQLPRQWTIAWTVSLIFSVHFYS